MERPPRAAGVGGMRGALGLVCLICCRLMTAAGDTSVSEIEYQGWENSIQITNGDAKLVVVPAIGRIMHYGLVDGRNILWSDPALHGRTLPGEPNRNEAGRYVWTNFGGDKIWPNEQRDFERINGYPWPPDHWFDGVAQEIEVVNDGVVMTSAVSAYNGARSVREIRLAETGTRVTIHQRIEKLKQARVEPLSYTIWSVTQIVPPQEILYRLNPSSRFEAGYYIFEFARGTAVKNFKVVSGVGVFTPDALECQKTGADSDHWLAAVVDNIVFAQFFERVDAESYPDGGLSAEVFTCPQYTELELLSPLAPLRIGQALEFSIAWELYALPSGIETLDQRRTAALEWLSTHY